MSRLAEFQKFMRYNRIYGLRRTLFKVAGRRRGTLGWLRPSPKKPRNIGVIGCGQFAFSTIGAIISEQLGNRFGACYDLDPDAAKTFADFYRVPETHTDAAALLSNEQIKYVYIASNHSTHAPYAETALAAGKVVYCEKPLATDWNSAHALFQRVRDVATPIFAGYNRPLSPAIRLLHSHVSLGENSGPITLGCFVTGHQLSPTHWYRRPSEGTRICGNVGHWLDLGVHILRWVSAPDLILIRLSPSNTNAPDDNLSICLTTPRGDLVTILLTARSEPFEGINESINFANETAICKIDDFRSVTIWSGSKVEQRHYRPKNVGHADAILQPFRSSPGRDWAEIEASTFLMLQVADMVRNGIYEAEFSLKSAFILAGLALPWE